MKRTTTLLLSLFVCLSVWGQRPSFAGKSPQPSIKGKISGMVMDSVTRTPLQYASISVMKVGTDKAINGTISKDDGKFKVPELSVGKYTVTVSFMGYANKQMAEITLTPKKPDADVGKIFLTPVGLQLDEVEITSERAVIESKVDRIIYNADQDVTTVGGTAEDVLRKVPLLSVDINGNVSLRGNANVRILMNGKPSGMFSNNVAEAIKMIPADEIKSVEVITTPGAKYDGEGSAGIINIITKKKILNGINGSFTGSLGNLQNNANLSINAGKGRFGLNGGANMYHSWPRATETSFFRSDEVPNGTRILDQQGTAQTSRTGFSGRFGMFYDANAYNSFQSDLNFRGYTSRSDGMNNAFFSGPLINQQYSQMQDSRNLRTGYDWNTSYTKTFKQKKREFSVATQVSGNISDTENELERLSDDPGLFLRENSTNDGDNLEITFQTDYTHPFSDNFTLEVGAKAILRDIDSDYQFDLFNPDRDEFIRSDDRSNAFDYKQDVYAGYVSSTFNVGKKNSVQAGLRYERTDIAGSFDREEAAPFTNGYENFLPSVIVSRKLKNFSTIKLSYNQRIQRPSLYYINPFVNAIDRRNISVGNPNLSPEIVHQVELGYNTFIKGASIFAAVFYRRTNDIIESVLQVDESGISVTSYNNVGQNNSLGFNVFGSKTIGKIWTIRGGGSLFTYDASGVINGQAVTNTNLLYRININQSLKLPKGYIIEMFGFFNSPRQTLQGTNASFWLYSFAAKKEIWKKRGSVGLTFVEPFNGYKNFNSRLEGDGFFQRTEFRLPFRSIGVNFSYRFGKLDFKQARPRNSKIKNTDAKQGNSNNDF